MLTVERTKSLINDLTENLFEFLEKEKNIIVIIDRKDFCFNCDCKLETINEENSNCLECYFCGDNNMEFSIHFHFDEDTILNVKQDDQFGNMDFEIINGRDIITVSFPSENHLE